MLSSAFTANISFYSNEIGLSPTLPESLAPSFGAGKPQHPNIPFAPSKSRLDVWVSNCEFCPEIKSIDNLATGTAISLAFATMKTVLVLVVPLLATVAKCLRARRPPRCEGGIVPIWSRQSTVRSFGPEGFTERNAEPGRKATIVGDWQKEFARQARSRSQRSNLFIILYYRNVERIGVRTKQFRARSSTRTVSIAMG